MKVKKLGVRHAAGFLYYVKGTALYRRKRGGVAEKLHDGIKRETGFLYYLDSDGEISRAPMKHAKR